MSGNLHQPRPVLLLLSGLPGAGKTTLAQLLAGEAGAVHIESDAVRHHLADRPAYTVEENAVVFELVEGLAREALREGRHAIVDATNLTGRDRRRFLDLGSREGVRTVGVRVTAPAALLRERVALPRTGHSSAGPGVVDRLSGRVEPFTIPSVVIDSRFPYTPALELLQRMLGEPL